MNAPGAANTDNSLMFNAEMDRAVTGILGMMRFGRHDTPVLLEALGDLLDASYGDATERDANWLAARAYLRASQGAKTEVARQAFRELALHPLESQGYNSDVATKLKNVEAQLKQELVDADAWYQRVRQDELAWIAKGRNVDAEFAQKYYAEPKVVRLRDPNETSRAAALDYSQLAAESPPRAFWETLTITGGPWSTCLIVAVSVLVLVRLSRPTARGLGDTRAAERIRSGHST